MVPSTPEQSSCLSSLSLLKLNFIFLPTLASKIAWSGNQFVSSFGSVMALKTSSGEASIAICFFISISVLVVVASLLMMILPIL
jgi:hypothetical protein